MEHSLSLSGFQKFEKRMDDSAEEFCRELIQCYNRGEFNYTYTTNQTKPVEIYRLFKMWHIMSGSGIFFSQTITKCRKDPERIRVRLQMSQQVEEYWDSDEEEATKSETATPPLDLPPAQNAP